MQPTWGPEAEAFREKIQAFLAEHLPADWRGIGALPRDEVHGWTERWRQTLADHHLLAPRWPSEYGGPGLTETETVVLAEEFAKAGVPTGGPNDVFGIQMVGNTILQWGTEEQKREFIPKILSGEHRWCQGYSEPNAGSDLANVQTRAALDGDHWVINGQKVWTSLAVQADWIFLVVRTDPDQSKKHAGLSFLLAPMDQPGVEIRPIIQATGTSEFNEVFLSDAETDASNIVGQPGQGWEVANALLGFERGVATLAQQIQFEREYARILDMAREHGCTNEPVMRQRLAQSWIGLKLLRYNALRTLTNMGDGAPGPEASISKLYCLSYSCL